MSENKQGARLTADYDKMSSEELVSFMEEATGIPADKMITQSGILSSQSNTNVLDNACGGGLVTKRLFALVQSSESSKWADFNITCGDLNPGMVRRASERSKALGWNATTKILDTTAIDVEDSTFDHVFTNFVIQMIPNPEDALRETMRVTKDGGKISFTAWQKVGWSDSFKKVNPAFQLPPTFSEPPWTTAVPIRATLISLGLVDVKVEEIRFGIHVKSAEYFVKFMADTMPQLLPEQMADKYVKVLQDEFGTGSFELGGWVAVVATGTVSK
ncbi:S-adenosyl-L-methionine-dependent methyltransferase [Meredithblackwellia eburnea MCA 4105]